MSLESVLEVGLWIWYAGVATENDETSDRDEDKSEDFHNAHAVGKPVRELCIENNDFGCEYLVTESID